MQKAYGDTIIKLLNLKICPNKSSNLRDFAGLLESQNAEIRQNPEVELFCGKYCFL